MPDADPRPRRIVRRALVSLGLVVLVLVVLAGAGIGVVHYQGTRPPSGNGRYVALGSSFGAGPGTGARAADSPAVCLRSERNYAHQLAAVRRLDLTDVTCSGATARNVVDGGQYFQPPQVDAVRADTELVTVTVGGNDVFYLGNLVAWSCGTDRDGVPLLWRPLSCSPTPDDEVERAVSALPDTMLAIADDVHVRAPRATLVFVDYATVLPETGSCPDRLPLTAQQLDRGRDLAGRLRDVTAAAARDSRSLLVRASDVTRGHDVCAADPWVFGYTFPAAPLTYGPLAYHPTERAMATIAAAVNDALPPPPPA